MERGDPLSIVTEKLNTPDSSLNRKYISPYQKKNIKETNNTKNKLNPIVFYQSAIKYTLSELQSILHDKLHAFSVTTEIFLSLH